MIKNTILIVEDNPIHLKMMINALQENYTLSIAFNEQDAFGAMKEHLPDLILLDPLLSGVKSYEICHHIRKEYDKETLPIVMLNSSNEEEEIDQAFRSGTNDYIDQHFFLDELQPRIRNLLDLKKWKQNKETHEETDIQVLYSILKQGQPVLSLDHEQRILSLNDKGEELLGYLQEELIGKELIFLFPDEEKISNIPLTLENKNPFTLSLQGKHKNGQPLVIETNIGKLGSGKEAKILLFFHSIRSLDLRESLVQIMNLVVRYWELTAGEDRIVLAELSTFWTVNVDGRDGGSRARMLDNYLNLKTIPKKPKVQKVLKTAEFVLAEHPNPSTPFSQFLKKEIEKELKQVLKLGGVF